jgi:hypothetical protein
MKNRAVTDISTKGYTQNNRLSLGGYAAGIDLLGLALFCAPDPEALRILVNGLRDSQRFGDRIAPESVGEAI